jgi:hypothetical protein
MVMDEWGAKCRRDRDCYVGLEEEGEEGEEENDTPHAVAGAGGGLDTSSSNWLSYAELSTSSKSIRIVPCSIYLSHQIAFYAFGED